MSKRLRVVTWNSEGMFVAGSNTRRATPQDAIETIKKLNADIVFIPEFGQTADIEQLTLEALAALGYQHIIFPYGQTSLGSYGAALLTRIPIVRYTLHHFTNTKRQFIEAIVELNNVHLRVIGIHLDDRSEELRLQQVPEVAAIVNRNRVTPTIVLGDFNAMHKDSKFARAVRTKQMHTIARHFPHRQLSNMGTRVSEMGRGTALAELIEHTNLHDLDGKHRRTISAKQSGIEWIPAWRLAKIDWILGSKQLSTLSYTVQPDVGSDHRPVLAEVSVAE